MSSSFFEADSDLGCSLDEALQLNNNRRIFADLPPFSVLFEQQRISSLKEGAKTIHLQNDLQVDCLFRVSFRRSAD